ncbi:ABC transporter permease [Bacillus sp. FJAT-47783]|uniref:ABC transporter permease n=1 Tax=Bacillus sp. FJAT-47783 TaxID=2922712 RepID=UPI001FAC7660|nr:ABC transporter permease [Bacillus sp. FJAT-47783]
MFLALREMKHAKFRYLLIGLIMVLIAWLVLFVSGLAKGLSSDNASSIQTLNANYLIVEKEANHRLNRSVLFEDTLNNVHEYANENEATPLGIRMATLTKEGSSKKIDATFFAIDTDSIVAPEVIEGKMINNETTNEIIVDRSLKDEDFQLGDRIKDEASGKEFEIVGFTKEQSFSHAPVIHMNFKEWDMIHETNTNKASFFNTIALNVTDKKAEKISDNVSNIEVITKDEALKGIPGYQEEQGSLLMMIAFLFVIAAFVLAVFFYVITIQKLNQFGVLKAIGAKSSYLARNIISQVLLLTVVSLIISIALTYGMAFLLPSSMPFNLNPSLVLGCSVLFIFVSVIGSLISLYRVAKIDAIEAIGRAA